MVYMYVLTTRTHVTFDSHNAIQQALPHHFHSRLLAWGEKIPKQIRQEKIWVTKFTVPFVLLGKRAWRLRPSKYYLTIDCVE